MIGLATKLFEEGCEQKNRPKSQWPLLEHLSSIQFLPYIDYALAESLLKNCPQIDQAAAAFLCHLSLVSRQGHLCVYLEDQQIYPHPRQAWLRLWNEGGKAPIPELNAFIDLIYAGANQLPSSLVTNINGSFNLTELLQVIPATPICCDQNHYYFQRYWLYETLFLANFKKIEATSPELLINESLVQERIQNLQMQNKLLPEQAQAILAACTNSFSIICGGPGTGKTYTAGYLIKILWEAMSSVQRQGCEIVLAAPTGKAAANLHKSLSNAVADLEGFTPIKAKTLHSLMGIRSNSLRKDSFTRTLSADIILVDESSMIDVRLMAFLLASIKPGARLILLGDKHQLPPVEAGALFADLIAYFSGQSSANKKAVELKTCLRAELRTIIDFAQVVNEGNSRAALEMLSESKAHPGISHRNLSEKEHSVQALQEILVKHSLPFFLKAKEAHHDPLALLESFNHFRLLSPLRKGPFGVDALNSLFFKHLKGKKQHDHYLAIPIMLTSNDYRLELFNGEVGVLVRNFSSYDQGENSFQEGDYAIFPGKSDDNTTEKTVRKLPALLLPKYEYAYCLSVHKSQGSEFDCVLLVLPEGAELFGREVLYTAVTRARKKLEIWGSDQTISATIAQPSQRLSGVLQRLSVDNSLTSKSG